MGYRQRKKERERKVPFFAVDNPRASIIHAHTHLARMELKQKLIDIVESLLSPDLFLVELVLTERKLKNRLLVILDGDKGIGIDQCAEVSRKLGHIIEEQNLITDAFTLEVASPGIDQPLKVHRQYTANIGRVVKIETTEGQNIEGTLVAVSQTLLTVEPKTKKKKTNKDSQSPNTIDVPLETAKKTVVQVAF